MNRVLTAVLALSSIFALAVAVNLVSDLINVVWYKKKGKPYQWKTVEFFNGLDATTALLFVLAFAITIGSFVYFGFFSKETAGDEETYYDEPSYEIETCDFCGEEFDERYAMEAPSGGTMCPLCTKDDFSAFLEGEILRCHKCTSYYYPRDSYGLGLCSVCCNKYVSSCSNCGEYTYRWSADDFSLCPRCAGEICSDDRVKRAIDAWFEG